MSITINETVQKHASVAQSVATTAYDASRRFNRAAERLARAMANAECPEGINKEDEWGYHSDAWYEALAKASKGLYAKRSAYVAGILSRKGYEGWALLDSGAFRTALRGPDGLVYKVGDRSDNETEARISKVYRDSYVIEPEGFRILDMHLVGDVLVTEFVSSEHKEDSKWDSCHSHPNWKQFCAWVSETFNVRVNDTHDGNVWWDGKAYVIIDMGNWGKW